jgi:hypothetical protein
VHERTQASSAALKSYQQQMGYTLGLKATVCTASHSYLNHTPENLYSEKFLPESIPQVPQLSFRKRERIKILIH